MSPSLRESASRLCGAVCVRRSEPIVCLARHSAASSRPSISDVTPRFSLVVARAASAQPEPSHPAAGVDDVAAVAATLSLVRCSGMPAASLPLGVVARLGTPSLGSRSSYFGTKPGMLPETTARQRRQKRVSGRCGAGLLVESRCEPAARGGDAPPCFGMSVTASFACSNAPATSQPSSIARKNPSEKAAAALVSTIVLQQTTCGTPTSSTARPSASD